MATSGSLTTTNSGGYRNVTFSWTLESQSVANNTSTISWSLTGASDGEEGWYYAGPFNATLTPITGSAITLVNNKYPSGDRIQLRSGTVVASGTTTFSHNSSGVGTFSVSVSASVYLATINCTGSGSFTPTDIPRASVFNNLPSSYTMSGSNQTINITRYLSGAYYGFSYKVGSGQKHTNFKTGSGTSISWDFAEIGQEIPTLFSTSVTFYLKTYTNSSLTTVVGEEQTAVVTINVPSTYSLTAPTVSVAEGNTSNSSGVYVQKVSRPKWTFSSVSGKYGSTITQYKVTCSNVTTSSSSSPITATSALSSSGTVSWTATITDSRGRTGQKTGSISVVSYTPPTLSATVVRSSSTPTTIVVTVTCSVSSVLNGSTEKNTMMVKAEYGTTTGYGTTKTIQSASSSNLSLTNSATNITGLSDSSAYYFKITVADKWNNSVLTKTVGANSSIIDIQAGKIGIGVRAGSYSLNVLGNTYLDGTLNGTGNASFGVSTGQTARMVGANSSSGSIYIYTAGNANGDGNRGIWLGTHGDVNNKWLIYSNNAGDVFLNGGTTPVGQILSVTNAAMTLTSGTSADVCTLKLTKGVWVIVGQIAIPGSAAFRVILSVSTSPGTYQYTQPGYANVPVTSSTSTFVTSATRIYKATASTNIYLVANQNSGSDKALTAGRCRLDAVCIA